MFTLIALIALIALFMVLVVEIRTAVETDARNARAQAMGKAMAREAELTQPQPRASHRLAPYCNDFEEVGGFIARLPGACSWANVQPVEVRSGDELLSAFTMIAPMRVRDVFKWANDVLNHPEWEGYAADLLVNSEWIGSTEL